MTLSRTMIKVLVPLDRPGEWVPKLIPIGAYFRHAETQGMEIAMWFEAIARMRIGTLGQKFDGEESREWMVVGTGKPIPPDGEYRATGQNRDYVWHLIERRRG